MPQPIPPASLPASPPAPATLRRWLVRVLLAALVLLVAGGIVANVMPFMLDNPTPGQITFMEGLNLDAENNLPTRYATLLLTVNAALLWANGRRRHPQAPTRPVYWRLMALVFVALALDESWSVHERAGRLLGQWAGLGDHSWILWVVPAALCLGLLWLIVRDFLARLPAPTRRAFLLAAGLYVGGALGFEVIGAGQRALFGWGPGYLALTLIEETLELAGQSLFLLALFDHLVASRRRD